MEDNSPLINSQEWQEDSVHFRGVVLKGKYSHWCNDWDGLPVDETTLEFTACHCFPDSDELGQLKEQLREKRREIEQDAE